MSNNKKTAKGKANDPISQAFDKVLNPSEESQTSPTEEVMPTEEESVTQEPAAQPVEPAQEQNGSNTPTPDSDSQEGGNTPTSDDKAEEAQDNSVAEAILLLESRGYTVSLPQAEGEQELPALEISQHERYLDKYGKDYVLAQRKGVERAFSRRQWNILGKARKGWKEVNHKLPELGQ